jgi:hypothetical protein
MAKTPMKLERLIGINSSIYPSSQPDCVPARRLLSFKKPANEFAGFCRGCTLQTFGLLA